MYGGEFQFFNEITFVHRPEFCTMLRWWPFWVLQVVGSNPAAPTNKINDL
ncbi:hypothetical protein V1290_007421 [Bradyrhizobium sp. AZCC 1578]